jgi:cyclopropane-fatty-acyl-phospholipid synthase
VTNFPPGRWQTFRTSAVSYTAGEASSQWPGRVGELVSALSAIPAAGSIVLPDGTEHPIGDGPPVFRIRFTTPAATLIPPNEYKLGQAYVDGAIEIEGDLAALLDVRSTLSKGVTPGLALRFAYDLLSSSTAMNSKAINAHYTHGDDLYLSFIDERYRFYSHCLFPTGRETLEEAAECKLESMYAELGLRSGMRLLDIGGGWGGVMQYSSPRGVDVTSVTLVEDSAAYIRKLKQEQGLIGSVVVSDFLDYKPQQKFDHAVIYGVIEHIPQYRRFTQQVWDMLPPGGRLYLDASATTQKWAVSPFTRKYTWGGAHSFLSLQDIVRELLVNGFEVLAVKRETRDYEQTIRLWADRLEDKHDYIAGRWGESMYRAYRVFLRGGQHAFHTNRLQAYHLVAQRLESRGPRPGPVKRLAQSAALLG